jgi:hypothetical protein
MNSGAAQDLCEESIPERAITRVLDSYCDGKSGKLRSANNHGNQGMAATQEKSKRHPQQMLSSAPDFPLLRPRH